MIVAMNNGKRTFNVVVLMHSDTKPDRDRLRGILKFASAHPEWNVLLLPGHPALHSLSASEGWRADGIITNEYVLDHERKLAAQWTSVPNVVLFDATTPAPDFTTRRQACVDNDNAAVGRLAADFFLGRGFRNLAYVQTVQPRRWSDERGDVFLARARANGCATFEYAVPARQHSSWGLEERRLVRWLLDLPKPCGLLAANDSRALQILRVAALAGLAVPEQLSVLGVDNNDLSCEFCRPSLSSVEPEFTRCGFLLAETLHGLMCGGKPPTKVIRYGNPVIVERRSTLDPTGAARIVSAAKAFIAANATRDIGIADVAEAVKVSPRTLERWFAAANEGSPIAELMKVRMDKVRALLADSTVPIGEIAFKCGFNSDVRLKIAFKKAFGQTMSAYRRSKGSDTSVGV